MTKIIEKEFNRKYKGYEITAKIHHERRKVTYNIYVTKNGEYSFTFIDESQYENFEGNSYYWLVADEIKETKKVINIILLLNDLNIDEDFILKCFHTHQYGI